MQFQRTILNLSLRKKILHLVNGKAQFFEELITNIYFELNLILFFLCEQRHLSIVIVAKLKRSVHALF